MAALLETVKISVHKNIGALISREAWSWIFIALFTKTCVRLGSSDKIKHTPQISAAKWFASLFATRGKNVCYCLTWACFLANSQTLKCWVYKVWPILHVCYIIYGHFAYLWGQTVLHKWVHNLCPLTLHYIIYGHFAYLWGQTVLHINEFSTFALWPTLHNIWTLCLPLRSDCLT